MILKKMSITSFGGLSSKSFDFESGLNIIVGPNESGKSTLFHAILNTLLTSVNLTKTQFRSAMDRFLPVGGGDTISCELGFTHQDQSYLLAKSWGKTMQAELILPDGSRKTGDVASAVKEILPVSEGTFKSVLMTYQSGLSETIEELKNNPGTVVSLSDILRKAVLETDSLSVGKFKASIEEKYKEYYERWDIKRQRPEKNRGIDNPYRKGLGRVLKEYYKFGELERLLKDVTASEDEYSVLNRELEAYANDFLKKEKFIKENEKAARETNKRSLLDARLYTAGLTLKNKQDDYDRWPLLLKDTENLRKIIPEVEKAIADLEKEKEEAENFEKSKELRARFERVKEKQRLLEKAEEKRKGVMHFPDEDMEKIREVSSKAESLKAALSAGRINLSLKAKADMRLSVEKDLTGPEEEKIDKGGSLDLHSEGRLKLAHRDWILVVSSGKEDYDKMAEEYKKVEENLLSLLSDKKVSTIDEAVKACSEYESLNTEAENARKNLDNELNGCTYENLEEEIKNLAKTTSERSSNDIIEELVESKNDFKNKKTELEEAESELNRLTEEYVSKDKLFEEIVELAGQKKNLEKQINSLVPIPDGFSDANSFISFYENEKKAMEELREEKTRLEIACAKAEENMPDESSEEVETRLRDTENNYESELKKARAVAKIKNVFEILLEELDSKTFTGFEELFAEYIAEITGKRYSRVRMAESLPEGLVRDDGKLLPYRLLSAGTKDDFAISLKLTMAEFFLSGKEGFLVMDDPLVDLDPDRQKLAAKVLSRFSENRQLVIFTCHPSHADLFETANRVELFS